MLLKEEHGEKCKEESKGTLRSRNEVTLQPKTLNNLLQTAAFWTKIIIDLSQNLKGYSLGKVTLQQRKNLQSSPAHQGKPGDWLNRFRQKEKTTGSNLT